MRPDIVACQELTAWNAEQAREFVESVLSPDGEIAWEARQQFDTITVSAFPILGWAPIDGNLVTLIDLPEERDLVLGESANAVVYCKKHADGPVIGQQWHAYRAVNITSLQDLAFLSRYLFGCCSILHDQRFFRGHHITDRGNIFV